MRGHLCAVGVVCVVLSVPATLARAAFTRCTVFGHTENETSGRTQIVASYNGDHWFVAEREYQEEGVYSEMQDLGIKSHQGNVEDTGIGCSFSSGVVIRDTNVLTGAASFLASLDPRPSGSHVWASAKRTGDTGVAQIDEIKVQKSDLSVVGTERIDNDNTDDEHRHSYLVIDHGAGKHHACWTFDGTADDSSCHDRTTGGWGTGSVAIGSGTADQDHITFALDSSGNRVGLFHDAAAGSAGLWLFSETSGKSRLDSGANNNWPHIRIRGDRFYAVWVDTTAQSIVFSECDDSIAGNDCHDATGGWSTPVDISDENHEAHHPVLAVDAAHTVYVAYMKTNGGPSSHRIRLQSRCDGDNWPIPANAVTRLVDNTTNNTEWFGGNAGQTMGWSPIRYDGTNDRISITYIRKPTNEDGFDSIWTSFPASDAGC